MERALPGPERPVPGVQTWEPCPSSSAHFVLTMVQPASTLYTAHAALSVRSPCPARMAPNPHAYFFKVVTGRRPKAWILITLNHSPECQVQSDKTLLGDGVHVRLGGTWETWATWVETDPKVCIPPIPTEKGNQSPILKSGNPSPPSTRWTSHEPQTSTGCAAEFSACVGDKPICCILVGVQEHLTNVIWYLLCSGPDFGPDAKMVGKMRVDGRARPEPKGGGRGDGQIPGVRVLYA